MNRRINITLPNETIELLDRIVPKGDRSRFINDALKHYIAEKDFVLTIGRIVVLSLNLLSKEFGNS
jgi:metal-responsive CopG/Arc/MetJ family transcriptional regulator